MKNIKKIILALIFIILLITILGPVYIYWDKARFENQMAEAIDDYSKEVCGISAKVVNVEYFWSIIVPSSDVGWRAKSYVGGFSGDIGNGKVTMNKSICESELNLVLHREKEQFLPDPMAGTDDLPSSWETYIPSGGPIISSTSLILITGSALLLLLSSIYFLIRKKG